MMKNFYIFTMICLFSSDQIFGLTQYAQQEQYEKKSDSVHLVDFKFDKRDLKDILNEFAQLRGINILYSSTTQLNVKVTFDAGKKIPFMKAWDLLLMMLEQSGFTLVNQGKDLYVLVTADQVNTTPLPTFINIEADALPLSQERIRYIYYFKNITLSAQQAELTTVLKNFFDPKHFSQQLVFDQNFNAMILTAKAEIIQAVMRFIDVFDQSGEKSAVDILQLQYANADEVETILKELINNPADPAPKSNKGIKQPAQTDGSAMFAPTTKVKSLFKGSSLPSGNGNSLVIFGKRSDIDQVKKFILQHLDVPLEKGKSFFHVVELQWLSASTFAGVLNELVSSSSNSGQSSSTSLSKLSFDPQIKIVSETISQGLGQNQGDNSPASLATGTQNTVQRGSNKLIIAATNKDWERIEEIIKKLDIPQKQIIIEALILDLSLIFTHKIASQVRTNSLVASIFPKTVQAQAAMLINVIPTSPQNVGDISVQGDLSNILTLIAAPGNEDQTVNSTICMIGNAASSQGIWAFFQLLALHKSTKTVSRAFVIAQNNQPAVITNSITKRLKGKLTAGVTSTISYQTVSAPVTVNFTPLISSNNMVNLQMQVDATYWADPANGDSGTAQTREITTNFSLQEGQVAVLGGLTKDQITISYSGVPFFEKIPLVNLLFTNRSHTEDKTKLFMIVKVTKIIPRAEKGMGKVSRRMAAVADHMLHEDDSDLFSSLKDPISHWVFDDNASMIDNGLPLHDLFMKNQ